MRFTEELTPAGRQWFTSLSPYRILPAGLTSLTKTQSQPIIMHTHNSPAPGRPGGVQLTSANNNTQTARGPTGNEECFLLLANTKGDYR